MDIAHLRQWIGRTETTEDVASPGQVAGLAALLDHAIPPWTSGELPPLAHWLYFLTRAPQSEIGEDGHPRRGGFLPPVTLPRRMWAGSRVAFRTPIEIGMLMTRQSTIMDVREKSGATGEMVFVTVRHEIATAMGTVLTEEQDIVYREAPKSPPALPPRTAQPGPRGGHARRIVPDPTQLFRFSALTFNAHRIHYDREYCRDVEGYPGLVVQGPFTAMLLMDHFLRSNPAAGVTQFEYRAQRPLYDIAPFDLCLAATNTGADLWALDAHGEKAVVARVSTA
ncbi:MAG: MaoC family dehydratase N-terminal domain-containing protein [Rhizomicrobium sp.]|jgi:3-methylfumaryl-CoA hydratase